MWDWFVKRIYYVRGDFQDPAAFKVLKDQIAAAEKTHGVIGNHFYYLAVAPRFFGEVVRQLGTAGLAQESNGRWARVIIEKPFGRDLDSARVLNCEIKQILEERQIYRIDHYLGKETVQNIMIFRFGNGIFEPIWNRRYIDHVQITASETVGVERRGGYYETAGALRDMVPNHLFQLVSLTAMEPPISFHADAVRDEQAKALHAIQVPTPEEVLTMTVRGQYGDGQIGDDHAPAYRSEPGVAPDSTTETFAGLKLRIDNWRWADVPFYLRTGKRLAKRTTEIAIQFKRAPFQLFRDTPVENLESNRLVLYIQPEEGLSLRFGAKIPGPIMHMGSCRDEIQLRRLFRTHAQHRLRAPHLRLHDRRRHACSSGPTWSRRAGASSRRSWTCGRRFRRAAFPITPPAPGGRRKRTTCWRATGAPGEKSNENHGPRRRRHPRQNPRLRQTPAPGI